MTMKLLLLMSVTMIATALQSRMPTLWWLGGVRIELLPALVAYGALSLGRGCALTLALVAGLAQDAFSAAPFGVSALAYGIAATVLTAMRDALDRDLPWVQMGAGALLAASGSLGACVVVGLSIGAVAKILGLACLSALVTPFLFFAMDYGRMVWRSA
jgi:rod shape-determining protein MreD